MTKYCRECLRELKLEEQNDEICKWCKEKIKERKFENLYDYNYINDKVIKDSWDNQAPHSDEYSDQFDWVFIPLFIIQIVYYISSYI